MKNKTSRHHKNGAISSANPKLNRTNKKSDNNDSESSGSPANRPRNYLITDATSPFSFSYVRFGKQKSIVVHQTPDEETWPGGALWDIGVLMARLLVVIMNPSVKSSNASSSTFVVPNRLVVPGIWGPAPWKDRRVLELGCGVGLTGLVAAAMGARVTLLTDLNAVVDKVTAPNVALNVSTGIVNHPPRANNNINTAKSLGSVCNSGSIAVAMPLCWGEEKDEVACAAMLDKLAPPLIHKSKTKSSRAGRKKKKSQTNDVINGNNSIDGLENNSRREGKPDLILIGDVAYQHKPGAPSHFDILMSTTLKFADEDTVVMFGTRMRMPASSDLLLMFREHFAEVVNPPIEAHEIDKNFQSSSLGKKHNITIHFFKRKKM